MRSSLLTRLIVAVTIVGMFGVLLPTPNLAVAAGGRTEIRTGGMLGDDYNPRWFYTRISGGAWQPTYPGSALEGRLMNFRAANAIFDDERDDDFDAQANTDAFVSNLDAYREHGILAFTISLQGGYPGYEGAQASAFNADGSLKGAWMNRASQVIEAADARGQIVILTYFYFRQDQILRDADAVRQAVRNATDWLIANDYRNVIVEIANEHNISGFDHTIIKRNETSGGIGELVTLAKSRFVGKDWRLPVSASHAHLEFPSALRATADLALPHGNLVDDWQSGEDTYRRMKAIVDANAVPVVMNEDDNGGKPGQYLLEEDVHAMDDALDAGGSWGLMWAKYNQHAPFEWSLGDPTRLTTEDGYFHAILDQIQARVGSGPTQPPPPPPGGGGYSLQYSKSSNRSNPSGLHGATVSGGIYAFTFPSNSVMSVDFSLDGELMQGENTAPFDFKGGSVAIANVWNTKTVADGQHTMTATMRLNGGSITTVSATFTVHNDPSTSPPDDDTVSPVISDMVVVDISATGATIQWTTDEPATSQVEYGKTVNHGQETGLDSTLVEHHTVQIDGLEPSTTYHFQVLSIDEVGNSAVTADGTFTTFAVEGAPAITGFVGVSDGDALSRRVYIEAIVRGQDIVNVVFTLSGPKNVTWRERHEPYYFLGNDNRGPTGWKTQNYPDGTYTLTAVVTNSAGQTGSAAVTFDVENDD